MEATYCSAADKKIISVFEKRGRKRKAKFRKELSEMLVGSITVLDTRHTL